MKSEVRKKLQLANRQGDDRQEMCSPKLLGADPHFLVPARASRQTTIAGNHAVVPVRLKP